MIPGGRLIRRRTDCVIVATTLLFVACRSVDHQAAGDQLVRDLDRLFPIEVIGVSFEYSPPLDPPTLFVDLSPSMDADAQRAFLCEQIWPRIQSLDGEISATVSHGWWTDEC